MKVFGEKSPAGIGAVVNKTGFDAQFGLVPAQSDDTSRLWAVNSFARLPALGDKVSEAAPEQSGYRTPQTGEKARRATSDYDASLTVPGAQNADVGPGNKGRMPRVESDAVALGRLFQCRFDECTLFGEKASEESAENMMR